jgi:hypothetical protein
MTAGRILSQQVTFLSGTAVGEVEFTYTIQPGCTGLLQFALGTVVDVTESSEGQLAIAHNENTLYYLAVGGGIPTPQPWQYSFGELITGVNLVAGDLVSVFISGVGAQFTYYVLGQLSGGGLF